MAQRQMGLSLKPPLTVEAHGRILDPGQASVKAQDETESDLERKNWSRGVSGAANSLMQVPAARWGLTTRAGDPRRR